jgi:hypothetical protein
MNKCSDSILKLLSYQRNVAAGECAGLSIDGVEPLGCVTHGSSSTSTGPIPGSSVRSLGRELDGFNGHFLSLVGSDVILEF